MREQTYWPSSLAQATGDVINQRGSPEVSYSRDSEVTQDHRKLYRRRKTCRGLGGWKKRAPVIDSRKNEGTQGERLCIGIRGIIECLPSRCG